MVDPGAIQLSLLRLTEASELKNSSSLRLIKARNEESSLHIKQALL